MQSDMFQAVLALEKQIFFAVHNLQRYHLDFILGWPTYLGTTAGYVLSALPLMYFWDKKRFKLRFLFLLIYLYAVQGITHILKIAVARPRPFRSPAMKDVQVLFAEPASHSFPSGHAACVFAAAVLLGHWYPRGRVFFYGFAVLVSLSRMYVGVHYPLDLLAGAALGAGLGLVAVYLDDRRQPTPTA
jgi:undecaprenyl-diphosphatase